MPWRSSNARACPAPVREATRPDDDKSPRNVASIVYPLIGPYNSASRNVVRYHLRTAQAAGAYRVGATRFGCPHEIPQAMPLRGLPAGIAAAGRHHSAAVW